MPSPMFAVEHTHRHDPGDNSEQSSARRALVLTSTSAGTKNLGRASRRRRKKMAEIQRAEEQLLKCKCEQIIVSEGNEDNLKQILPSDRDKVLPGVCERRKHHHLDADAHRLISQLGYVPGNAIKVAARVSDILFLKSYSEADMPVVVELYPMVIRDAQPKRKFKSRKRSKTCNIQDGGVFSSNNKGDSTESDNPDTPQSASKGADSGHGFAVEPFPTLYWLTHPLLRVLVSKLELKSMGSHFEKQLEANSAALESMKRAHKAYAKDRYDLLTQQDIDFVKKRKWESAFSLERGVAGIRNFASVKCLHAHLAHYLSGSKSCLDNIVGKWVMESVVELLRESADNEPKK